MATVPHNASHKVRVYGGKRVCMEEECEKFGQSVGDTKVSPVASAIEKQK